MVGGNRVGDALQQHRLTGTRRRHDETALPFADGRKQIHHAAGEILPGSFQAQALVGIERREIAEEDLVARFLRRFKIDGVDFDEREVTLALFRRPDLSGDSITGAKIEAPYLRRRYVNVVRPGQVVVLGRAQETESVRQAFQDALGENEAALLSLRLQNLENQLLLAKTGGAHDSEVLRNLVEILDAHVFELYQIESIGFLIGLRNAAAMPLALAAVMGTVLERFRATLLRLGSGVVRFCSRLLGLSSGLVVLGRLVRLWRL